MIFSMLINYFTPRSETKNHIRDGTLYNVLIAKNIGTQKPTVRILLDVFAELNITPPKHAKIYEIFRLHNT